MEVILHPIHKTQHLQEEVHYDDEVPHNRTSALPVEPDEPQNYKELINPEHAGPWNEAMIEEYNSVVKNNTWILAKLPPGRVALNHKKVGKYKPAYVEVEERWKARLTVVGSRQKHGVDFNETYAPVPRQRAIKIFLSYVAVQDLDIIQFDIKTAFLYAKLKEVIYMKQPEGFVVKGKEDYVCQLLKSLYELKQAPYEWNEEFNAFLVGFGLTRSEVDPFIYHRRVGDEITLVVIYVDDGLVASNKPDTIT